MQYTRNTVTGASTAELAVLLVDARNGVVEQTRRHAAVLALLRVPRLVLAVNKIDLVDYDEALLTAIAKEFAALRPVARLPGRRVATIPVSALRRRQRRRALRDTPPGTTGPTLLEHLESVPVAGPDARRAVPVPGAVRDPAAQRTSYHDYRGYAGQVAAGHRRARRRGRRAARRGAAPPSPRSTPPTARWTSPAPGRSVTLLLADDIDISRGDLIAAAPTRRRGSPSELDATLCWLAEKPLRPGARLLLKHGTRTTQVIVGAIDRAARHRDADRRRRARRSCRSTTSRHVALRTADPLPVDDYADVRATGSFLLIDPPTGNTLAAGLVGYPLADALG